MSTMFEYYGFKDNQDIVAIIPDRPEDASFLAGKSVDSLGDFKKQIGRQTGLGKSPRGVLFGEAGSGKTHCLNHLKYYFINELKDKKGEQAYEPVYIRLSAWENKKKIFNQFFYNLIASFDTTLLTRIAKKFDDVARSKGTDINRYLLEQCKDMCQTDILQSMGIALDKLRNQDIEEAVNKGKNWFLGNLSKRDLDSMDGANIIMDARECADVLRSLNRLLHITLGRYFVFLLDEGQQFGDSSLKAAEEQDLVKNNIKALLDDPYIGMILAFLNPPNQSTLGSLENSFFRDETIKRRLGMEIESQPTIVDLNAEMNDAENIKEFICGDDKGKKPGILQHWLDSTKIAKIIKANNIKDASVRYFPYDEEFIETFVGKLIDQPIAKKPSRIIDILGETMYEGWAEKNKYGLPIKVTILDDIRVIG